MNLVKAPSALPAAFSTEDAPEDTLRLAYCSTRAAEEAAKAGATPTR
jgi:hypothetical protein